MVEPGRVTGLIGPNGAGKTTLFNVITGLQFPDEGRVVFDGTDITTRDPFRRARMGIARTFQRLEAFGTLSARDNVLVAAEQRPRRSCPDPARLADDLLELVGVADVADQCVATLPTGTARRVELARALATGPRVLLLDEPSSGLDDEETRSLAKLLAELAASGLAVLLVEHDMSLVMSSCQHIYVLDFGRVIAEGDPDAVRQDAAVQAAYLGGEARARRTKASSTGTTSGAADHPPVLELCGVRAGYGSIEVLHGVDLAVRAGQVHALLGPNGAGKTTTLRVASGQLTASAGTVRLCGFDVTGVPPDAMARTGVCAVPEGRGVFPNLTVAENLRMMTHTGVNQRDVEEIAFEHFPRLRERRNQLAGTLSGGEQQMLAMVRALATRPALLLLDELSMGLAPLIVEELYAQVASIAATGVAILIVEQFAETVLGVADIASVMLHGRVRFSGPPAEIADELAAAYLGGLH
jgi:ABC-type branched-subunit amino acid transport system ATPase component